MIDSMIDAVLPWFMCHLIYHNIFVCCSAVQPSGSMLCGLCVAINMMSLVCDANPQKTSTVCTLHSAFVHLSLILFIYYLLICFFSKHGVLAIRTNFQRLICDDPGDAMRIHHQGCHSRSTLKRWELMTMTCGNLNLMYMYMCIFILGYTIDLYEHEMISKATL